MGVSSRSIDVHRDDASTSTSFATVETTAVTIPTNRLNVHVSNFTPPISNDKARTSVRYFYRNQIVHWKDSENSMRYFERRKEKRERRNNSHDISLEKNKNHIFLLFPLQINIRRKDVWARDSRWLASKASFFLGNRRGLSNIKRQRHVCQTTLNEWNSNNEK